MHCSILARTQIGICFFILLFFTACPPDRPEPYLLSNDMIIAYRHEVNMDSLKQVIAKDSLTAAFVLEEGLHLFQKMSHHWEYQFWMNDSLLLAKVDVLFVNRREGAFSHSGGVRYEQKLRKDRFRHINVFPVNDIADPILSASLVPEYDPERSEYIGAVPFEIKLNGLTLVDSLNWTGMAFGQPSQLNFKNGKVDGIFIIRDSSRQLLIQGTYDEGTEVGNWEYRDWTGKLQWTEVYEQGELQKIKYAKGAHLKREARKWTVREIILLHRIFFFIFLGLTFFVFWQYLKSFKNFTSPYTRLNGWEILAGVLASPFLALLTMIAYALFWMISAQFLKVCFGLDFPFDILTYPFLFFIFYFFVGLLSFIATFRVQDVLWHSVLLCLLLFVCQGYQFLKSMGVGVLW